MDTDFCDKFASKQTQRRENQPVRLLPVPLMVRPLFLYLSVSNRSGQVTETIGYKYQMFSVVRLAGARVMQFLYENPSSKQYLSRRMMFDSALKMVNAGSMFIQLMYNNRGTGAYQTKARMTIGSTSLLFSLATPWSCSTCLQLYSLSSSNTYEYLIRIYARVILFRCLSLDIWR